MKSIFRQLIYNATMQYPILFKGRYWNDKDVLDAQTWLHSCWHVKHHQIQRFVRQAYHFHCSQPLLYQQWRISEALPTNCKYILTMNYGHFNKVHEYVFKFCSMSWLDLLDEFSSSELCTLSLGPLHISFSMNALTEKAKELLLKTNGIPCRKMCIAWQKFGNSVKVSKNFKATESRQIFGTKCLAGQLCPGSSLHQLRLKLAENVLNVLHIITLRLFRIIKLGWLVNMVHVLDKKHWAHLKFFGIKCSDICGISLRLYWDLMVWLCQHTESNHLQMIKSWFDLSGSKQPTCSETCFRKSLDSARISLIGLKPVLSI